MVCIVLFQTAAKRKLDEEPDWTARRAYNHVTNNVSVDEAASVAPFTSVERSLKRFKVHNRPPLPATRQDLVLLQQHTETTDGHQLLLVDDGLADRLLVFGTDVNFERLVFQQL
jgi:hypothetical protein